MIVSRRTIGQQYVPGRPIVHRPGETWLTASLATELDTYLRANTSLLSQVGILSDEATGGQGERHYVDYCTDDQPDTVRYIVSVEEAEYLLGRRARPHA